MSMPFNTIQCSNCEHSSWLLGRNGWKYYKLPHNKKLTVHTTWSWCYDCEGVKATEHLPTKKLVLERLQKAQAEIKLYGIKKIGFTAKLLQLLGKDKFEIEQIKNRIKDSKKWLILLEHRSSPSRCLSCSNTHIKLLDLPQSDGYKKIFLDDFKHPNCGGSLWLSQHEMRPHIVYTPKVYDTEGLLIKEE